MDLSLLILLIELNAMNFIGSIRVLEVGQHLMEGMVAMK